MRFCVKHCAVDKNAGHIALVEMLRMQKKSVFGAQTCVSQNAFVKKLRDILFGRFRSVRSGEHSSLSTY